MDGKVRAPTTGRIGPYGEIFGRAVADHPERVAARDAGRQASFAELDAMSLRLAGRLQEVGVCPRDVVAIGREHAVGTLAAILAVFRCGAAYLPLDPDLPLERLRRMLDIGRCTVVLADAEGVVHEAAGGERTVLDVEAELESGHAASWTPVEIDPADPAYVLFTSGSTGEPKGAVLSHANMVNHLWSKVDALRLCASDIVAVTASIGFDLSVWQYLVGPLVGASTAILSRPVVREPLLLLNALAEHAVTVFEAVPSHLSLLMDVTSGQRRPLCPTLRAMVTAGEVLPMALVRRWFAQGGPVLVNAYGPTECGVDVTHYVMHQAPSGEDVPIGSAIDGCLLVVVDEELRPVPEGEAGELLIGGTATGLGYLNAPERTAAAFVSPPGLTGRFYRSGDRVRHRRGVFEFLGRIDLQIKLRGFRIEPEEIEASLHGDPDVRRVAVVLLGEGAHAELVAVVQAATPDLATPELRARLHKRAAASLPDYMCPARVEFVHTLPLNSRDKVDRHAIRRFLALLEPNR